MNKEVINSIFQRRKSKAVQIGMLTLGDDFPVLVQSMIISATENVNEAVKECKGLFDAGAEMVRITAQTEVEAETLSSIKQRLKSDGYNGPLVADIHYEPGAALIAAKHVDKVRINPGNFTDTKRLSAQNVTAEAYDLELKRLEIHFKEFLKVCQQNNTALRIGCNHGSLSDRILSKYGDTPMGMAESVMEFLRICKKEAFNNVVVSMKASDVRQMIYATRLVVKKMQDEQMDYPIHLGVTEAGEGEDARIKSAIGIGTLLAEGIGDTIRVSLTEPSVEEIPVANFLVETAQTYLGEYCEKLPRLNPINAFQYHKFGTKELGGIGGANKPKVLVGQDPEFDWSKLDQQPDFFYDSKLNVLRSFDGKTELKTLRKTTDQLDHFDKGVTLENCVLILRSEKKNQYSDLKNKCIQLINKSLNIPVIFEFTQDTENFDAFMLECAAKIGGLFADGLGDGILIRNQLLPSEKLGQLGFGILQNVGVRITRTQYIACPSCGRTNFDLLKITKQVKEATKGYSGIKIAVMGCIVNGLGEMADADYAYVGAGKNQVNLYHKKQLVKRSVPVEYAIDSMVNLICSSKSMN